jgi:hypothetical protein
MLDEFVDDASQARGAANRRGERTQDECSQDLVRRIASETGIPQFHLAAVVEKVLATVGPQIEERLRKELDEAMQRPQQNYNDSLTG